MELGGPRRGVEGRSCRSDGSCQAQRSPGPDMAPPWTRSRAGGVSVGSPSLGPGPVRSCAPAGLDPPRLGAAPTESPGPRTGPWGSPPAGFGHRGSGSRARQTCVSVSDAAPAISTRPTHRTQPLRRIAPPTCAPSESCDPAPRRSRSGSHPPTGVAPPLAATLALTPDAPRSANMTERANSGTMSLRESTSGTGTIS